MIAPARDGPVLVPVANPLSAPPLLACAAALAGPNGTVQLVTVVSANASPDVHAHARQGLTDAEQLAGELQVTVRGHVRVADDAATGVLDAIAAEEPALVVMGWRGRSSTTDVFGRMIDHVVGRSSVPLAVIRLGSESFERILLPVSAEHLLPGGSGSLSLAVDLTRRLRDATHHPTTVLRTGPRETELPPEITGLGDRVHHDPRRTHKAVESFARPTDVIVAAVAPTASGLRGATTHLAWAAPEATLLVAVDVGPVRDSGLVEAVSDAGRPAPTRTEPPAGEQRIVVTIRVPDQHAVGSETVEAILRTVGDTDLVMSWWPVDDDRAHIGATVTVRSEGPNRAMAAVMTAVHDAPELQGAEISYELDRGAPASQQEADTTSRG